MTKSPKSMQHRRRVRFSVVLPAAVDLIVGTDDDEPNEDSEWKILEVVSASCEASPRMVEENMSGTDAEALNAAAANAEDLP